MSAKDSKVQPMDVESPIRIACGVEKPKDDVKSVQKEDERVESTLDILDSNVDARILCVGFGLNIIQALTYISVLYNRQDAVSDASFTSILIVLVFSALSMTSTGYGDYKRMFISLVATIYSGHLTLVSFLLHALEFGNFILLFLAAVFIVPGQGDPLNIVLNCTALTAISGVDETFLGCFEFHLPKNPKLVAAKKEIEEDKRMFFVMIYVLGFITIFVSLLVLYSLYSYTATQTV